jgi:hypothetical protein
VGAQSFTLVVENAGSYTVKVWHSPYWAVKSGDACVGRDGDWTTVRAARPGLVKIGIDFSRKRVFEHGTRC